MGFARGAPYIYILNSKRYIANQNHCLICGIHRHPFNGILINLPMRGIYESKNQETPIMGQAL